VRRKLSVSRVKPSPTPGGSLLWEMGVVLPRAELAPLFASPKGTWLGPVVVSVIVRAASCPIQKSQSTQPRTVPVLPKLTTETGDMRS